MCSERARSYVGEVTMWLGLAIASTSALKAAATTYSFPAYTIAFAFLSPAFEYALINFVSGVPMLEKSSDEKFGDDPAYKRYKQEVRSLFPLFVTVRRRDEFAQTPVFWPKFW